MFSYRAIWIMSRQCYITLRRLHVNWNRGLEMAAILSCHSNDNCVE
jgi:hypothetical protein